MGFHRQWADHPGGKHVVRDFQAPRLVKQPQYRLVKKPVFELEARAECVLPNEDPDCTAWPPGRRKTGSEPPVQRQAAG